MTDKTTQPREQADQRILFEAAFSIINDYRPTWLEGVNEYETLAERQAWDRWKTASASTVAAPEAPTLHAEWKRSSAEDLQRDGYEWDREWLEGLAAQVNRRGLHVSTSAVEALVCLLATPAATTASASGEVLLESDIVSIAEHACLNANRLSTVLDFARSIEREVLFRRATAPSRNAALLEIVDTERKRIAAEYQRRLDEGTCEVGGHVNRQWAHLEGAVKVVQALRAALTQQSAAQAPNLDTEADAARYRWLRDHGDTEGQPCVMFASRWYGGSNGVGFNLDAAIDLAMSAATEQKEKP